MMASKQHPASFTAFDILYSKREIPAENTAIKEEKYIK